jgi:hypothetical protein
MTQIPGFQKPRYVVALQETYDLDAPLDETAKKLIDAAGAGQSNMSPGWLTELGRLWGGTSVSSA